MKEKQLIFGCMGLGGGWNQDPITVEDEKKAQAAIEAALEIGIKTFDHADIYTLGKAEEVFGKVLKSQPGLRDKMIIQSKTGICLGKGPGGSNIYNNSKSYIIKQVEDILQRLQIETLDTLLIHRPDVLMDGSEIAETFEELESKGYVKEFGVSNMSVHQIKKIQKYWKKPIVANQLQLSLGHSLMIEGGVHVNTKNVPYFSGTEGLLEFCQLEDIAIQTWGSLDKGKFTERNHDELSSNERETALMVKILAEKYKVHPNAIVLAWLFKIPGMIQPIIGTTAVDRILGCRGAQEITLSHKEWYGLWISAMGNRLP